MCSHNPSEELNKKRHSAAHLLAMAVREIRPDALFGIGPIVDDGFYYDIETAQPITEADLKQIEKRMKKMISHNIPFERSEISIAEAKGQFKDQKYKLELIDDLATSGEAIVSVYTSKDFADLCRGPHVENSKEIDASALKITRLAGAYWKSDEKREQLTRIYGVLFDTKEELDIYLARIEEAKRRDHRKLGKELDLFTFSELVGGGLPLFTPKGTLLRDLIVEKIQNLQKKFGYQKVTIPHITKKDLYEKSGHWAKFGDELFKVKGQSDQEFVMKPMNCPHHTQIYASHQRSYRDLPVRYMETTMVYRDEQAGELLGLSRVRSISQDDGHVFCTPAQIETEVGGIVSVIKDFYTSLNMFNEGDYWVSVSVRNPKTPEKYLGDPAKWDKAEKTLEDIAKKENLPYKRVEGEAAFYGPKLDFMFRDAIGREWQLATAQLDFVMPERFGLEYTDETNAKQTPVMLHRAIAGSLERFLSVIIEHFAGAFPLWLSPVQIVVIPVSDKFNDYGKEVCDRLMQDDFRVELYDQSETLGKRVRVAQKEKVPYILVVGEKEVADKTVSIRSRENDDEGTTSVDDFITKLQSQ
ncbi:MAG: threonine--tRNA ligase [Parcubacteria group bacterium]|jgi:threonyl-tRNA synthetase